MASTTDSDTSHHVIDFTDAGTRRVRGRRFGGSEDDFGLWSCRFSADDKEIVAGGDSNIFGKILWCERPFSMLTFGTWQFTTLWRIGVL